MHLTHMEEERSRIKVAQGDVLKNTTFLKKKKKMILPNHVCVHVFVHVTDFFISSYIWALLTP